MTKSYLTSITADSLSGIIFALEGVVDSLTVLNGPTGCKFYHSASSDNQMIRQLSFDPLNYPPNWYFGQPRVPCTYLDDGDYVYGAEDKLREILEFVRDSVSCQLVSIVNSPGASLIGDDLAGIARDVLGDGLRFVTVETPGFSSDACHGHETAMLELLRQVPPADSGVVQGRVNVIGLSLNQRNGMGDAEEIRRMLELCGATVGCMLSAGCTVDEIMAIPTAELNVVVSPEYGLQTARYLEERYGMPYVVTGPPIGFAASERFARDVCSQLGACDSAAGVSAGSGSSGAFDPAPLLDDISRARARSYAFVSRVNSISGMPKGVAYAIEGRCSELCAYVEFLAGYLGMLPIAVRVLDPESNAWADRMRDVLEGYGMAAALERDMDSCKADIVFGSGNTIASRMLRGERFSGIETHLPTIGYHDVVPKTYMGPKGALLLVEMVLNGLIYA